MRILVLSHHHPDLVHGGAGRAAYALFQKLKRDRRVEFVAFVAPTSAENIGHPAQFGSFRGRPDEILVCPPSADAFTLESVRLDELTRLVTELIRYTSPDVVHLHHVLDWGIEIVDILADAGIKVILTLHDFTFICHNHGQMQKTSGELCHAASPAECCQCFPEYAAGKFFLRSEVSRRILSRVTAFVAPSRFLADRHIAWGIPQSRLVVIDNLLADGFAVSPKLAARPRAIRRTVFGFFANWTPFKGIELLLEAWAMLPKAAQQRSEVRLYGENKYWRNSGFSTRIDALLAKAPGNVRRMGPYRNEDVLDLMRECDWVTIASTWWENSPVVIQEAKLASRRILCPAVGGMLEKVDPEVDLTFVAGSPHALAERLEQAIGLRPEKPIADALGRRAEEMEHANSRAFDAHLALYGAAGVRSERRRVRSSMSNRR